ncbi:hypothetical protein HD806DRAFT_552140 [Xylariaceae sp. AK1471]|nr:hypothetical protein HD806DRAFT_552140 [Xylariaceae sp. AK1471]
MVQLATFIVALSAAISTVSATCTCVTGQNYCGYELLNGSHGSTCGPADLLQHSPDYVDQLYKCNNNGTATQIQFCGGPGTCQPPQHVGGACDGTNSCCGT